MDDGDPPLSNSSLLTVVLIDVDDVKPQFTHDEYQIILDPSGYKVKFYTNTPASGGVNKKFYHEKSY